MHGSSVEEKPKNLRLAQSAGVAANLLELSDAERQHAIAAAMLINSGKAHQLAGLKADIEALKDVSAGEKEKRMLEGYAIREAADYAEIASSNVSAEVVQMLQENVRHDPSQLKTDLGKLIYFLLYCQKPDTGELVPVEDRVNASIHMHPIYGQLYAGYAAEHNGEDLVTVHQQKIAEIEAALEADLHSKGHQFENLKAYLKMAIKLTQKTEFPSFLDRRATVGRRVLCDACVG